MADVTVRELRNQGGTIIERVLAGEFLTVTRDGTPVAELRPLRTRALNSSVLLERWRNLPPIDSDELFRDIDDVIDQAW